MRYGAIAVAMSALIMASIDIAQGGETRTEVSFSQLAQNRTGDTHIVEINPLTEVLVFDGGELTLRDHNLIIVAPVAILRGETKILSFQPGPVSTKQDTGGQAQTGLQGAGSGTWGGNGGTGETGVAGDDGQSAGKVILRIGHLTGEGLITIALSGQDGGTGAKGGKGGNGGNGAACCDRKCPQGRGPLNGGGGGKGGRGGDGGAGGAAGNGGIITYTASLDQFINSGQLLLTAASGQRGAGGIPGDPGSGGAGGGAGAGGYCGNGSDMGPRGGKLGAGSPGKSGPNGAAGQIVRELQS